MGPLHERPEKVFALGKPSQIDYLAVLFAYSKLRTEFFPSEVTKHGLAGTKRFRGFQIGRNTNLILIGNSKSGGPEYLKIGMCGYC